MTERGRRGASRAALLAAFAVLWPTLTAAGPPKASATAQKYGQHQSHGHPNSGRLVGAARWRDWPWAKRLPDHAAAAAYGMPGMIELIDHAAHAVARSYPHSVLIVGDLSLEHGGPIAGHASHQNGRDMDVGFYTRDAHDKPVVAARFLPFGADGKAGAGGEFHFDDARNWAFVRALLTDGRADVRSVFVAAWLRARLLREAERTKAPKELFERAASVMLQPDNAEPHDDHFHVRVACPPSQKGICHDDSIAKSSPIGPPYGFGG